MTDAPRFPHLVMSCDHVGCRHVVRFAPRILVPSVTWFDPHHRPLRMMTTLHYCDLHWPEFKLEDLLTPDIKVRFEQAARRARPIGFKCEFERAQVERVLVTTPEYRAFLGHLAFQAPSEAVAHV
ncbi:MAG TPA: hypothetical protein VGV37_02525 [Aliidongia sp.]|uniref:hypothetical protein n=1 Tax=Aliidongia sp. TaxID=1914230 RepID=UPI002DDD7434|nr:hypothetical protein [Aliidongia sp.]HEV2673386.1 hypothetical protein [Aliidongia sp.]